MSFGNLSNNLTRLLNNTKQMENWLFSVSEAGAKANAICLSLAETAKANGIDFYKYLVKLMTELPNVPFHKQSEILHNYMPWSENIQASCAK